MPKALCVGMKRNCPACGERSINVIGVTFWSTKCSNCGAKVQTQYWASLIFNVLLFIGSLGLLGFDFINLYVFILLQIVNWLLVEAASPLKASK